jgi:hypothetical protein
LVSLASPSEDFIPVTSGPASPFPEFFRANFDTGWYDATEDDDVDVADVTSDDFRVDKTDADADSALTRRIDERSDRVGLDKLKYIRWDYDPGPA